MIDDKNILRGETFSRLKALEKHYSVLREHTFPTDGSQKLAKLILEIVKRLQLRFDGYTINHIRHIGMLCGDFEAWCGYLLESRITNVPWSIVPTLEQLFQSVKPGSKFAICPIWESNYKILNRNIVDELKKLAEVPNLLFDATTKAELETEVNTFFNSFPTSIYFVFFPKAERLSALHFALLGHEIGHTFAQTWLEKNFPEFLIDSEFIQKIERLAGEEVSKSGVQFSNQTESHEDIFVRAFQIKQVQKYYEIIKRVLAELISDVFGAYLFGETSLIASYLFGQRSDFDSILGWEKGYPSFRYRLLFIWEAIAWVKKEENFNEVDSGDWQNLLEDCVKKQINDFTTADRYIQTILSVIESEKKNIFQVIRTAVIENLFCKYVKKAEIEKVRERLSRNIVPNAFLDDELKEYPIEFRNILYGTCMYLAEQQPTDKDEYEQRTKTINLLSLKGIELATEQVRFNNDAHQS